jgi:alpha-tubulin suppressor-like RCC1 family protein
MNRIFYSTNGKIILIGNLIALQPLQIFYFISTGEKYTTFNNNGQIWSWGRNLEGQLGNNSTINQSTPVSIFGLRTFCSISSGIKHSLGIDYKGQVWGWGYGKQGQLGNNTLIEYSCTPISVQGDKKTFCSIKGGDNYTISLDNHGQIWGWGYNVKGQIGDNSTTDQSTPVSVYGVRKTFCSIGNCYSTSFGIDYTGQVWGWGNNYNGEIGNNDSGDVYTPISIKGNKKTFCKIIGGQYHSISIDYTGQVWGWGYNIFGQIGNDSTNQERTPVSIYGEKKTFCSITASKLHSLGIDYKGQIWGWGYNNEGQLGNNSTVSERTPVSVHIGNKTFCSISTGPSHSIAIDKNGEVWGWGSNYDGQLGIYNLTYFSIPTFITNRKKTKLIATAGWSSFYIKDGQIWGWGNNYSGTLGNNSTVNKSTPISIQGNQKTFCNITAAWYNTNAIDFNGQVWSWGSNSIGGLGNNSTINESTPVSIYGRKKTFCSITTNKNKGDNYIISLEYTGQMWSWGSNSVGGLGNNSTINESTPVSIHGNKKTFCAIGNGDQHTIAIEYTGQMWSWGYNNTGQLGNNSTNNELTPVSIYGNKKTFCKINGGDFHTIGVDYTGQVWSWGNNNTGGLGNNSTNNELTPVSIHGNKKTFCKINGGNSYTIGIDYKGQIWGWGYNNEGQLGNNSTTNESTPVSIHGNKKTFCAISVGIYHTIAIDYIYQVWGWGYNNYGQLGNNQTTSEITPVKINI